MVDTLSYLGLDYNRFDPKKIKDTKEYYFRESNKAFIRKTELVKKVTYFFKYKVVKSEERKKS